MKMDLRVSLTWLLLLSATFLPEPGSAALERSQKDSGTRDLNSIWKKLDEWLKGLFHRKDPTPAPTSSPASTETPSAPGIWTTLEEVPTTVKEEIATSAPEIATTADKEESKTPEVPTTPHAASEDAEELHISSTPLTEDGSTSAPEILSTAAESSTDNFVTDNLPVSDAVIDSTDSFTTPALPSTLSEGSSTLTDVHICDSVGTALPQTTTDETPATASPTPEPDVNTSPAKDTTPEAEVLIKATTTEKPVTHSPNPSVSLDSGAAVITTSHAKTDRAPVSQAKPISLPQRLRMELLRFLAGPCGPRRPGMQSIQLQGCVKLPTCRNYHSPDKRIIKFDFRDLTPSRACLHCNVLACNRYNYSPQHYWGHRTRDQARESVIIRIIPK